MKEHDKTRDQNSDGKARFEYQYSEEKNEEGKQEDKKTSSERQENDKGHNTVEIITFIFGILVLVGLLSFLIYQWNTKTDTPPTLTVTSTHQPEMEAYAFFVEVENTGDESAAETQVQLNLYQEGENVESGTLQFRYIPAKSKESGWIVFHKKRRPTDSLVVSSVTYIKP